MSTQELLDQIPSMHDGCYSCGHTMLKNDGDDDDDNDCQVDAPVNNTGCPSTIITIMVMTLTTVRMLKWIDWILK